MKFVEIFKNDKKYNTKKDIAIKVSNVSKYFKIYHEKPTTLFEQIFNRNHRFEIYYALKNINFEINKGEFIGIIGKNGCGKSTLLRIIAKILRPSEGFVEINGTIASILELGVGFNQEMTAKENISLYASIIGIPEKQIENKIQDIINFSNLENFKDTKIKNYSSGMYSRLAFATAIQSDPDILLVDEVLAVGDIEFQQKCFNQFLNFKQKGKTIVLVSHDLNTIQRFCDKVLLIENGRQVIFDETKKVINEYIYSIDDTNLNVSKKNEKKNLSKKEIQITKVVFLNKNNTEVSMFKTFDFMKIRIFYNIRHKIANPVFGIIIHDEKGNWCIGTNTDVSNIEIKDISGKGYIDLIIPRLPLNKGNYSVSAAIAEKNAIKSYDYHDKAYFFNVINVLKDYGTFIPEYKWSLEGINQHNQ